MPILLFLSFKCLLIATIINIVWILSPVSDARLQRLDLSQPTLETDLVGQPEGAAESRIPAYFPTRRLNARETEKLCSNYKALYQNIKADLAPWAKDGITVKLIQDTIRAGTMQGGHAGFAVGFREGKAYILQALNLDASGHYAEIMLTYMRNLLYLEALFEIPDVDFVINVEDVPTRLSRNISSQDLPIFRFCKSKSHPDVLVPNFHFHSKHYDNELLSLSPGINKQYPWKERKETAFGRFSLYNRFFNPADPTMPARRGLNNANICPKPGVCTVRRHFVKDLGHNPEFRNYLNVTNGRRVTMQSHAAYKYLVHLDGQGASSRLEQLLTLGSLVLKEESGYHTFYHHLLVPYSNYVPFWKNHPDEIMEVIDWARANDAKAKRIADNGQQFASRFLNKDARACYWHHLLHGFSKLQKYQESQPHEVRTGRRKAQEHLTVEDFLKGKLKDNIGELWRKFEP